MADKNTSPLFSIIIPCYNQAHFLPECLDSILIQRFQNWEAIVINDGATDNTSEIARQYKQKDDRIRLVEKGNGGLSSARNKGIQEASGNYFIFLDADDLILNDCLQFYDNILTEDVDFIQSGYLSFKDNIINVLYRRSTIRPYANFYQSIHEANIGPVNGFVLSKKMVQKVGFFNEKLTSCEDWDYWIRASKAGFIPVTVNHVFAAYRFVSGSMGKHSLRMLEQGLRVINSNHLGIDSTAILSKHFINVTYKKATIEHLIFTTSIALFNGQNDSLDLIKEDYFDKIDISIDSQYFKKLSNYQTYRDFSVIEYFRFYIKNNKTYKRFFNYLEKINCIDSTTKKELLLEVFPNTIQLVKKRIIRKLKK